MQSSCDRNLQSMQLIHIFLHVPRQYRQEIACCLFFRPSSSLICSEPSVVLGVTAFLTAVLVKLAVVLLFRFHYYSLCVEFRKVSKVFWISTMCWHFFEVDDDQENHQNGRKITIATGSCCLHRRGSSIGNLSFHSLSFEKCPRWKSKIRTWKLIWYLQEKEFGAKVCWWHKGCHLLSLLCLDV